MDKKSFMGRALPYVVAVVCFAALCGAYFAPQFEGREIVMHDVVQYQGSSKDIDDHIAKYGEDPQWTGNSFAGMPASLISIKYPGQILKKSFKVFEFMGRPASMIFIAMVSFFVMLVLFRVNPWVAVAGAVAYGFSTYFILIIGAGHITKMVVLAYAPLIVGGVFYTLRRNMWLGAALTAFFASLQIAANHPQITYYFAFIILALWINELVRAVRKKIVPRFAKATGLLAIAAVLALGSNLAPLYYVNEYSEYSIRGGSELTPQEGAHERKSGLDLEYATAWSYGIGETFNLYIPNLYGGSANFSEDGQVADALAKYGARRDAPYLSSYWGDQPGTAGPTYLGAAALFFAVMALFMFPRRKTMWVVVVSLVAIMLAWGHNFMWFTKLFFYWFPGYDKFRTVSMILVIVQWSVPFLGALALAKLWRAGGADGRLELADGKTSGVFKGVAQDKLMAALKYTVVILGGIALFFLLFGGMIFSFASSYDGMYPADIAAAMRDERASMMRADAFRSLAFVLLGAGVVFLYARRKIGRGLLVALAAVLICIDLVVVDLRFLPHGKFESKRKTEVVPTEADRQIMQDTEPGYRVFNLTNGVGAAFNEANTSYFHRSIGGYHGAKMQRYQDVIDRYLMRGDFGVLNMLNTKYVIQKDQQTGEVRAMLNPDANGAAWFVETSVGAANADEEIAALATIDTKREMVVDERFAHLLTATTSTADSTSYITLTEYRANYLKYDYYASDETYAVFSEIYYDKGWQAYVDGEPREHFRADYILRGMVLPAGQHTVEFRFREENFDKVSNITLVFSLLIIAALVAAIVAAALCNRKKHERQETEA